MFGILFFKRRYTVYTDNTYIKKKMLPELYINFHLWCSAKLTLLLPGSTMRVKKVSLSGEIGLRVDP